MYYIIAIAKDEPLIHHWVQYHLELGFDKVFIGDNGLTDLQLESLEIFIKGGKVELLDYRHQKIVQLRFYNEWLKSHKGEDSWVAVIDCDEYIHFKMDESIDSFIKRFPKDCYSISLNWMMHVIPEVEYIPGKELPIMDPDNIFIKSIHNLKAPINDITEHTCNLVTDQRLNWNRYQYPTKPVDQESYHLPVDYRSGFIQHNFMMGLNQWIAKCDRGYPNSGEGQHRGYTEFSRYSNELFEQSTLNEIRFAIDKGILNSSDLIFLKSQLHLDFIDIDIDDPKGIYQCLYFIDNGKNLRIKLNCNIGKHLKIYNRLCVAYQRRRIKCRHE